MSDRVIAVCENPDHGWWWTPDKVGERCPEDHDGRDEHCPVAYYELLDSSSVPLGGSE